MFWPIAQRYRAFASYPTIFYMVFLGFDGCMFFQLHGHEWIRCLDHHVFSDCVVQILVLLVNESKTCPLFLSCFIEPSSGNAGDWYCIFKHIYVPMDIEILHLCRGFHKGCYIKIIIVDQEVSKGFHAVYFPCLFESSIMFPANNLNVTLIFLIVLFFQHFVLKRSKRPRSMEAMGVPVCPLSQTTHMGKKISVLQHWNP